MPHLEEQFPPVNPLVLQRPDALDPPDREREESTRRASRAEDELPLPGSLADGIDRVTISASARVIVPVSQGEETSSLVPEAQRGAIGNPEASDRVTSLRLDSDQVLVDSLAFDESQPPAFPELDPNEPFVPNVEPGSRAETIPAVAQQPITIPPAAVEDEALVTPPPLGNVEALDENPQALRRDNLGTDPALRSNREIRSFLQQFNEEAAPPEAVTDPEGPPITEVQNNAPQSLSAFDNLEALREERLDNPRDPEEPQGVTRPEEERAAPPEPLTPESLLTGRGQNIDRFI